MSTISKLKIKGIRSFGNEKDDEQKISFTSPLTLIVGVNGSGKTTIIECLKYGLTGEVPPGTNRGQGFVHDPNIFKSTESLGQVMIEVKDIKGNSLTCTRSMKTSLKKKKLMFETMDSTIHVKDQNGKSIDISKRCADTTSEMCHAMGVSKSILNNVIFCHQEDSNWPLDEGKKVKEKFDAIFETTQYNKAIEKIIKHRKKYQESHKEKISDLKVLEIKKKECENKQLEMQNSSNKLEKLQKNLDDFDMEMKPIEERMAKIYETELHIGKLAGQKTQLTMEINSCKEKQVKLKNNIRNFLNLDLDGLIAEIESSKSTHKSNERELQRYNNQIRDMRQEEKQNQIKVNDLEQTIRLLVLKLQTEQNLIENRSTEIQKICQKLDITIYDDVEDTQYFGEVFNSVKSKIQEVQKEIQSDITAADMKDHDFQVRIDKLREEKTAAQTSISSKKAQKTNLEKEERTIQQDIREVESCSRRLTSLLESIQKAESEYETYEKNANIEEKREKLASEKTKRQELKDQLAKIEEEFNTLHSVSAITNEIQSKTNDKLKKESDMQQKKNKHVDNLNKLFPDQKIEKNFKVTVKNFYDKTDREFNGINKSLNDCRIKANDMNSMRMQLKKQLKNDEEELVRSDEMIYEECQGADYPSALQKMKDKIEELQMEYGFKKSSDIFYKKFIKNINRNSCCPLCHKDLVASEANDLEEEIREKIQSLPSDISSAEKILKEETKKYEKLMSIRSNYENIEPLKKKIESGKDQLKKYESDYLQAQEKIEKLETEANKLKSLLTLANNIIGDMSLLDELNRDIQEKVNAIEILRVQLPENVPEKSLEAVKNEKRSVNTQLDKIESSMAKLEDELQATQEKLHKLRDQLDTLKSNKSKMQDKILNLERLKQRAEEIDFLKVTLTSEIDSLQEKLQPIQSELDDLMREKESTKRESKQAINEKQIGYNEINAMSSEVERLSREIQKLRDENNNDKMNAKQKDLDTKKSHQKDLQKKLEEMQKKIEDLTTAIANHELNERNLRDNYDMKLLEIDQVELEAKYEELKKNAVELDIPKLAAEKKKLMQQSDNIQKNRGITMGQITEIQCQIDSLKNQLEKRELKNAQADHLKVFQEATVIDYLMRDLNKYKNALEWALMKYHSEKMFIINARLKHLWTSIYQGNDIDFIQIRTDEIGESSGTEKRRNFNYRVVASRNGVEIDMRGRCSAGQKVLASLIIRIALAETFSCNCAVLALDEPTTNLDRENIEALSGALEKLVNERGTSNLMLIIITHDEEFVRNLGKSESYFQVFRNQAGKSEIVKK